MTNDFQLWKAFLAASETLSFTRAAERLGISQPRFSLLIRCLEDDLGLRLFVREHRRVTLTPEGERLKIDAKALSDALRNLDDSVWELRQQRRVRLRIGSPRYMLEIPERIDFVRDFHDQRPSVKLEVDSNQTPLLLDKLRAGDLDLVFGTVPFDTDGLESIAFAHSDVLVAIPEEDPAAQLDVIPMFSTTGRTFATYPTKIGAGYFDAWYAPLAKAGALFVESHDDHPASLIKFAAQHRYWAVIHRWKDQRIPIDDSDRLVVKPLLGGNVLKIAIRLIKREGSLPAPAQSLWDMARERSVVSADRTLSGSA